MSLFGFKTGFQTRSVERNDEIDRARWNSVEQAVVDAMGDIDKEMTGLRKRWNDYLHLASTILDSSEEYSARNAEDERALSAYESEAQLAGARIRKLEGERKQLQSILNNTWLSTEQRLGASPVRMGEILRVC